MTVKIVGDKLLELATGETNCDYQSWFVKSACNRYYYYSFLNARELMLKHGFFNPSENMPHGSSFGSRLHNSIKRTILNNLKNQPISDEEKELKKNLIETLCSRFSKDFAFLYSARHASDYIQECSVISSGKEWTIKYPNGNNTLEVPLSEIQRKNEELDILFEKFSQLCSEIGH